jgi:hypothetical protein
MDKRKQMVLDALSAFAEQRPGVEPGNHGDWKGYRSESRSITKDLHEARILLAAVRWRDSITADHLIEASKRAYSGRLEITEYKAGTPRKSARRSVESSYPEDTITIDYCTGQYFPTEFRKAVCAVLAYALWNYIRADIPNEGRDGKSPGDLIRATFRKEFGRHMQQRWFN